MPNDKSPNESLKVYLRDHYAGGVGALELLEAMSRQHAEDGLGSFFTALYADVKSDHEKLREIMQALDFDESNIRNAGAWMAEKFGRAKVGLSEGDAELRTLQALETLYIGITGKRLLWRALGHARAALRVADIDLAALEERALAQLERVEGQRLEVAREKFSGGVNSPNERKPLRYAVIGDSYSIGEGATAAESWPALLALSLTRSGIAMELVSNPSRTGWTTQDAIERELPEFRAAQPDFASLMLGVNDWVQGVEEGTFRARLAQIMDEMLTVLPNEKRLLVVNIPDFSVTPAGPAYARGRDISAGLGRFNRVIGEEAAKRGLPVVDIFPLSKKMGVESSLLAADGLHPSAKAYAEWEALIFPAASALLEVRPEG